MIFEDDIMGRDLDMIKRMLKEIPLETRFKVPLEMEYLNLKLEPDTCCSDEMMKEAHEWASKITDYLLIAVEECTKDGASMRKIPVVPPEDLEKLNEGHDGMTRKE